MRFFNVFSLVLPLLVLVACTPETPTVQFTTEPTMTRIEPQLIDEASGIADSRTNPGALWVVQDGGNPTELALLGADGAVRRKLPIANVTNRDWEDLAIGPGPQADMNYLYIADIGDNTRVHAESIIYRLPEPTGNVPGPAERITFTYPDGPRDAETLMSDPQTRDLYIVTKSEARVRLYRLAYPQSTTEKRVAEYLGELPFTSVTGGAFSASGSEIILRTYISAFYWSRKNGQTVADAMQRTPARDLPLRLEPQGEAICFNKESGGYFTLSERNNAPNVTLNYYARR